MKLDPRPSAHLSPPPAPMPSQAKPAAPASTPASRGPSLFESRATPARPATGPNDRSRSLAEQAHAALASKLLRQARKSADPLAFLLQQRSTEPAEGLSESQVRSLVQSLPARERRAFHDPIGPDAMHKVQGALAEGRSADFFTHFDRAVDAAVDRLPRYKYRDPATGLSYPAPSVSFDPKTHAPYVLEPKTHQRIEVEPVETQFRKTPIGKIYTVESSVAAGFPTKIDPRSPKVKVLENPGFTVGFNEKTKEPDWVAYHLSRVGKYDYYDRRPDGFLPDHRTKAGIQDSDYRASGYDRGHMAPNFAIMKDYGPEAQDSTFLMSNIVPQKANLNQYAWMELEMAEVKNYAQKYKDIWVITGPIFEKKKPTPVVFEKDPSKLQIHEVYAAIDPKRGDANGDGRISSKNDEFIELRNSSDKPMDISGFQIKDGTRVRHTFPPGTIVGPGKAALVFGGGRPTGEFGNVAGNHLVFTASSGSLSLDDSGDRVTIVGRDGKDYRSLKYGPLQKTDPSIGDRLAASAPEPQDRSSPLPPSPSRAPAPTPEPPLYSPGRNADGEEIRSGWLTTVGKDGLERFLDSGVAIPDACYKIIVRKDEHGEYQALSFILPQTISKDAKPEQYLTSIDEIERRTGYDFLAQLPDATEAKLEAEQAKKMW